jgi:ferrous-iron efflux pump FieF
MVEPLSVADAPRRSSAEPDVAGADRAKTRTTLVGLLFGVAGLLPGVVTVLLSGSVTLLADLLKSGTETVALLLTWLVLLYQARQHRLGRPVDAVHLEAYVSLGLCASLCVAFAIVVATAVSRLGEPVPIGQVEFGVLLSAASAVVNARLWLRNRQLARDGSLAMRSQAYLFRTKLASNLTVIATLLGSVLLLDYAWARYLDPAVSLCLAAFIGLSAVRTGRAALRAMAAARPAAA